MILRVVNTMSHAHVDKTPQHSRVPAYPPSAHALTREGDVFFVGGSLPIDDTLTTMFDSFCQESTSLFHLTLGSPDQLPHGIELARQIKRNFHARLMARLSGPVGSETVAALYAAGIDLLDVPLTAAPSNTDAETDQRTWVALRAAVSVFPRWAVASSLPAHDATATATLDRIDTLLAAGVVPLVFDNEGSDSGKVKEYLAAAWERRNVPLTPFIPLIRIIAADICPSPAGGLRGVFARLRDRQQLVAADLRRHLRVQVPTDSLDSAGL